VKKRGKNGGTIKNRYGRAIGKKHKNNSTAVVCRYGFVKDASLGDMGEGSTIYSRWQSGE
jgi:hypothetical protein